MASTDPLDVPTPDDSGRDAFERFRYQAMLAIPFCVDCALGGKTIRVVAEHIEDLAVQSEEIWRFIQIKTRDLQRGPWRLADLVAAGGAFWSLLRSHRALAGVDCTLEAFLEGPIHRKDSLRQFNDRSSPEHAECVEQIQTAMGLDAAELSSFVDRLRVRSDFPNREYIENHNLAYLGRSAPDLTTSDLRGIHDELVGVICAAMAGNQTFIHYPMSAVDPESISSDARALVEGKVLGGEQLKPICARLAEKPRPIIARMVETDLGPPTVLEQKMLAGGAPAQIVQDAKTLRANAEVRRIEMLAMGGLDEEIEDIRETLRLRANSQVALHEAKPRPASAIWDGLFNILTNQANAIDPKNRFGRPDFLVGEVCELADECVTNWGEATDG